jgi:Kef-type K+ transport system membrane component KefB
MSRGHKTVSRRLVDALSLALVFGVLYAGARFAPRLYGDAPILVAIGFLLLAGTLTSELVEVIGVPHLTGYLLAGIIAGPHVLHLIDHDSVKRMEAVNTLAIALIALAGGAELRIDALRRDAKSLGIATLAHSAVGFVAMVGVFCLARPGFVRDMPFRAVLGVALLWGVLAITRSPSATLGVLSQTHATGPLARKTLAFVMASDVVVVVMLAAAITIARPLIDPMAALSLDAFAELGHELLGSVAMGTTLGLLLSVYLRLIGRQLLVVLVALGYGATEVLHYVHFEPLLTFIVAGFVVQNLSKQGDKFLHAIEDTGAVVYVLFFAGAGAHLNVPLLKEFWPIALLLTGSRAAATFVIGRASARLANDEPTVKKWGWAPLLSQAGVALGIAQVISRQFPSWGPAFRDVAVACIAINELGGPVLFKLALDRAKETKAPMPSLDETVDPNDEPRDRTTQAPRSEEVA